MVDSSVWINYLNGVDDPQSDLLDQKLTTDVILIGDIILLEVLQGIKNQKDFHKVRSTLDQLMCMSLCDKKLAIQAASNYRLLRKKGITIRKTIDMIIATWCIEHNVPLLHKDSDFDQISRSLPLQIVD